MLENVDLVLRSAFLGIAALLFVHFLTIRPFSRKSASVLAKLVTTSGMVIVASMGYTQLAVESSALAWVHIIVMSLSAPIIAWALLELFDDHFEIKAWHLAFAVGSFVSHIIAGFYPPFGAVCHIMNLAIYGYIFYVAVHTWEHDLVQARCYFRAWFMSAAGVAGILFSSLHWFFVTEENPVMSPVYYIFKAGVLLSLIVIFAYWSLAVRKSVWAMPDPARDKKPSMLGPAETALLARLQASMEDAIWKQEGLTIRALSEELNAPEHRLRRVINKGLGYRNFSAFVNEHRIGAACEVLADPIKADIPIINIAYDVGYASLGPFNRAFKEIVGESPTEYRKRSFAHA